MGLKSNGDYLEALASVGRMRIGLLEPSGELEAVTAAEEAFYREVEAGIEEGVFFSAEYACQVFDLNSFERRCVQFLLLTEVDSELEQRFWELNDRGDGRPREGLLTPELACRLELARHRKSEDEGQQAEDTEENAARMEDLLPYFRAGGKLSRFFLSEQEWEARAGLFRTLKLNRRMRGFLLEREWEDRSLSDFTKRIEPGEGGDDGGRRTKPEFEKLCRSMEQVRKEAGPVLYYLWGPAGSGKEALVREFCRRWEQPLFLIRTEELAIRGTEVLSAVRAECLLYECAPCLVGWSEAVSREEEEEKGKEILAGILEFAASISSQVFILSEEPWTFGQTPEGMRFAPIAFGRPDALARLQLWERFSKETVRGHKVADEVDFRGPANKFKLTEGQIRQALENAAEEAAWRGADEIDQSCVELGCRRLLQNRFRSGKAVEIPCIFGWDDLVLPSRSLKLLRLACDQVIHAHTVYQEWGFSKRLPYGRGLSMLFCGPPGTGKTMGAQVVAGDLKLPLYRVNLAAVVSKYVGETEKNLQEIFEDAEKAQAVLFFDEADVLFGKRTEIKGSNDKYGNMEAAYLLQKMEEYEGICVLGTNYLQNFDEAFKRRIKFVVDFPFPDQSQRLLLWNKVFPPETPVEADVDREYLAQQFELSGSSIKNIAVNAAFEAAATGKRVSMAEILQALKNELIKSGKTISAKEWGEYYTLTEQTERE